MSWEDHIEAGNQDYQRELAISLVRSMGVARALYACQVNGWDGVLERVLGYRDSDKTPAN
jgi:hypothetical protein